MSRISAIFLPTSRLLLASPERRGQPYLLKLRRAPQCQTGDAGKRFGRTPVPAGKGEWGEVGLLDWGQAAPRPVGAPACATLRAKMLIRCLTAGFRVNINSFFDISKDVILTFV